MCILKIGKKQNFRENEHHLGKQKKTLKINTSVSLIFSTNTIIIRKVAYDCSTKSRYTLIDDLCNIGLVLESTDEAAKDELMLRNSCVG